MRHLDQLSELARHNLTAVGLSLFYATIYRESGSRDDLVVYHDAFAFGMLSVGLFLALPRDSDRNGPGDDGARV